MRLSEETVLISMSRLLRQSHHYRHCDTSTIVAGASYCAATNTSDTNASKNKEEETLAAVVSGS